METLLTNVEVSLGVEGPRPSYKGWKLEDCALTVLLKAFARDLPIRDGNADFPNYTTDSNVARDLPIRDGNEGEEVKAEYVSVRPRPSYKGWKPDDVHLPGGGAVQARDLPIRDGNIENRFGMFCRFVARDLPIRDGNPAPETAGAAWPGPARDLPIRDGNTSGLDVPGSLASRPRPSYKGWKRQQPQGRQHG